MSERPNGSQLLENKPDTDPALEVAEAEAELRRAIEQERRLRFPNGVPDTFPDLSE